MNLLHAAPEREYDAPLRFLLAIPTLLLLLRYPPSGAAFWAGLGIGAIGAGIFAVGQGLMLGDRAGGFTNPIQYGNISILLGILCLAGLHWAATQRPARRWAALLLAGAMLGVLGSIATGSRGSWIGLPFCLAVLYKYYGNALKKQYIALGVLAVALGYATLYAMPHSMVKGRIELAVSEANDYVDTHDARTSTGARLEMWRAGIMLLNEKPLLGWGKKGYMDRIAQLVEENKVDPIATEHSHVHNEYLDAWVKRGIPGLLATLILYFAPLWLFFRQYRNGNDAARPYAAAGIMLCLSYLAFGLTQAFLTHNNGVMLYAFTLAILWAMSRKCAGHPQQPQSSL
jgi:O-antigen ligase